ncbi:MAG TPA: hypothetical protein VFT81_01765, partial [Dermatophilaceae bacterium]|nr:hypothetical protein [Dermatophilaceae bacterium]
DADFLIAAEDAAQIAQRLAAHDLLVVQPPEDWLFKVYVDDAMVDVIFGPKGVRSDRALLERATPMDVLAVEMPVLPATELLVLKLNAMSEHYCDFSLLIPVARALREQVDWDAVRRETRDNDYAAALLFLLTRLGIIDEPPDPGHAAPRGAVR